MRNKFVQISLLDIYNDISSAFEDQNSELLSLIDEYIDFNSFISFEFYRAFYKNLGRKHTYSSRKLYSCFGYSKTFWLCFWYSTHISA